MEKQEIYTNLSIRTWDRWRISSRWVRWFRSCPARSSDRDSVLHRWIRFFRRPPSALPGQQSAQHSPLELSWLNKRPVQGWNKFNWCFIFHLLTVELATLLIPMPRRIRLADLRAVYSTRLCRRMLSELSPPTMSLHGKSVACWKKEMSGHNLLKMMRDRLSEGLFSKNS